MKTPSTLVQKIRHSTTYQSAAALEQSTIVSIAGTSPAVMTGITSTSPAYEATWLNAVKCEVPAATTQNPLGVNYYDVLADRAATVVTSGQVAIRVAEGTHGVEIGQAVYAELTTGRAVGASFTLANRTAAPIGTAISPVTQAMGYVVTTPGVAMGATNQAEGSMGMFPYQARPAEGRLGDVGTNYVLVELGVAN